MHWREIDVKNNELYTYEYFKDSDICRLCWNKNANKEIYAKYSEIVLENRIADIMKTFLEIDVYKTHLHMVCEKCSNEIQRIIEFKTFCQANDRRLHDILTNIPTNAIKIDDDMADVDMKMENEQITDDIFNEENNITEEISKIITKTKPKVRKKCNIKNLPTFCKICSLNLESTETLSLHNAELHGIENDGTLFKCFGCKKRFKSKKARLGHEVNFCNGLKNGYKCEICERFLPKRCVYESHMRDHTHNVCTELPELLFKCGKCKERFKTNEMLKSHMLEHGKQRNYICDVCGRVFTRRDYLYKHKLMHDGVKQHQCPHCDFKATQRSSLTVHIRKHTGERPYSCDLCPQRCVSSSNLRAHHRRHLGEKKYECNICHKRFGYKLSLEEHITGTHVLSESHPCEHCGATYTRKRGLRRHLAAKHGKLAKQPPIQNENDKKIEDLKETEMIEYELKNENVLLLKHQDGSVYLV